MAPEPDYATMTTDIIFKGTLRKAKTWNKRFFVLREGPRPKLEYYESEKKWKGLKSDKPKRQIDLDKPWNINKKKDSKHDFLIVIFTADEYFTMAADSADIQQQWVDALQKALKPEPGSLLYKHVWHVTLENKELDLADSSLLMNLHGPHRVCLTHDCMVFVHANHSGGRDRSRGGSPVEIRITTIRVCGHKENAFFIEPGRLSGIGSGKLWMDLGDEVMAAQMHTTILSVMFALREEEANISRGRSNSSGSGTGRTRPIRSHHNNPPPSQIGMGKVHTITSKRMRCDSLPGSHGVGAQDSRLRTGSEGEGTMRRPNKFYSVRSPNGSISPGMRNRLFGKKTQHRSISHGHSASLTGSCHSSSEASSTEQLNSALNSSSDFSSGYTTCTNGAPPAGSDSPAADEYGPDGHHSPTNGYMQVTNHKSTAPPPPRLSKQHIQQQPGRCSTPEVFNSSCSTPPIHEDTPAGKVCPNCLIHLPQHSGAEQYYCHQRVFAAPPPPNEQPPSNPLTSSSNASSVSHPVNDYVNVPIHSRTHSLDDSLSCNSTAASSLSASPQQHSHYLHHPEHICHSADRGAKHSESYGQSPSQYSFTSESGSFPTASPKGVLAQVLANDCLSPSPDDYALMDFDASNRYPHQINTSGGARSKPSSTPPSSTNILARLASFATSVTSSSSSPSTNANPSEYTSMSVSSPVAGPESAAPKASCSAPNCNGYVPMRAFKSLPQDIEKRRRSVPDAVVPRNGAMLNGLYGHSPEKCHCAYDAYAERGFPTKAGACEHFDSRYATRNHPSSPHYNCHLKLSGANDGCDVPDSSPGSQSSASTLGGNPLLATPLDSASRLSTPSPSNSTDYLSMRPLNQELREISAHGVPKVATSSSPPDSEAFFKDGYLPMSPVGGSGVGSGSTNACSNGANGRRATVVGPLLNGASEGEQLAKYPHQRKERSFSTNSLDRPKHKSKRPKTLRGLNHHPISNTIAKRSFSLKHSKKPSLESTRIVIPTTSPPPAAKNSSTTAADARPPLSPGGEYVNIDFSKAQQQQANSPYVVTVTSSKDAPSTPRVVLKQSTPAADLGSDYTDMTFDALSR